MQASCAQAPERRADPRVVMALAPRPAQRRDIRTRFFTGTRVYNAVLGEFSDRSRAVKSDPVWTAAHVPHLTPNDLATRVAAFRAVEGAHGFTVDAAQAFASQLRKSWVREHLPAQETQNMGARAFDAVKKWHIGRKGKPRHKPVARVCARWRRRTETVHCAQ